MDDMPPLIEAIEHRRGERTRVTVDGEGHDLPTQDVLLAGLREGAPLEPERWATLLHDGRRRLAVQQALRLLASRSRTEAALRSALEREFDADAAAGAVERMRELGYLDDLAWARLYLERPRSTALGRAALRLELRRHGVPEATIAEALASRDDGDAALEAARKRWRALRNRPREDAERRLRAYLQRRGFASGDVQLAVRACLDEASEALDVAP